MLRFLRWCETDFVHPQYQTTNVRQHLTTEGCGIRNNRRDKMVRYLWGLDRFVSKLAHLQHVCRRVPYSILLDPCVQIYTLYVHIYIYIYVYIYICKMYECCSDSSIGILHTPLQSCAHMLPDLLHKKVTCENPPTPKAHSRNCLETLPCQPLPVGQHLGVLDMGQKK